MRPPPLHQVELGVAGLQPSQTELLPPPISNHAIAGVGTSAGQYKGHSPCITFCKHPCKCTEEVKTEKLVSFVA